MNSPQRDTALPVPGFPIRKSPDQCSLSNSPKLIAASHVLHRLLAPRHPPCALSSLIFIIGEQPREKRTATHSQLPDMKLSKNLPVLLCTGNRACDPHVRAKSSDVGNARAATDSPGGADRVRTGDLRLAKPALSQLSYSPTPGGPR